MPENKPDRLDEIFEKMTAIEEDRYTLCDKIFSKKEEKEEHEKFCNDCAIAAIKLAKDVFHRPSKNPDGH